MKQHPVIQHFKRAQLLDGDCYVADYTQQTASKEGVTFSPEPFDDIEAFQLASGRRPVQYIGVNLEQHPAFCRGMSNCECFFTPNVGVGRPWLLLLELKYCKAKNVPSHASKAVAQMAAVLGRLAERGIINPDRYRVYFNYSSPENSRRQPFTHFMHTPADAAEVLRRYNAYFMGFNRLIIAGPEYIRSPKIRL